jgi:hypothetical protein
MRWAAWLRAVASLSLLAATACIRSVAAVYPGFSPRSPGTLDSSTASRIVDIFQPLFFHAATSLDG